MIERRWCWVLIVVMVSAIRCGQAEAGPVSPLRGLLLRPQWSAVSKDTSEALASIGTWGSVAHGFQSAHDDFGWAIAIGAAFELWRWNGQSSLIGLTDMELTARTDNNIFFNPKGGFWEEGLLYAKRSDGLDYSIGYLHRCRHDVDNGDTTEYRGIPNERTLIYGSLSGRLMWHPTALGDVAQMTPWVSGDLYVFREDYRQPSSAASALPNFRNILFSVGLGSSFEELSRSPWRVYARWSVNVTQFGVDGSYFTTFSHISRSVVDYSAELGLKAEGPAGRFEAYVGVSSFDDDGSNPVPTRSTFLSLGVRLSSRSLIE